MGEAAPCLMRSVSQPFFAACEYKEGDPLRALTTSISFGRFMTEPLDWERWSSFSHNRTLEDVQKYSRPGAVAEKKAFFEAHYKKIAARKAAKSPEKENKAPNYSPETNVASPTNLDPTRSNSHSSIDETPLNESPTLATDIVSEQKIASTEDICSPIIGLVCSKTGDNIFSTRQVEQEKTSTEDVLSPSSNQIFTQFDNIYDNEPGSGQVEQEKTSKENVSSENFQFQVEIKKSSLDVDAASDSDKISGKAKPEIMSSKSSSETQSARKAPMPPVFPRKAARNATEKKRSNPESIHMSMNFPLARSLPFANKNGTLKSTSKPKDSEQALTRVSVNRIKGISHVLPRSENRRSKTQLGCSENGSRTVVMKSLSTNHLEACTKKPRSSSTVTSSFSFRSEDRAAKRKEVFFQKLEEKGNTKETGTIPLEPKLKEKARNDNKKLRRSTVIEGKPSTSETKMPSNNMQEVPPAQPCSPKPGRKPTNRLVQDTVIERNVNKKLRRSTVIEAKPSTSETKMPSNNMQKVPPTQPEPKLGRKPTNRLVQDTRQSPWRSSSKPKNFIEMNKKNLSKSMASLPTKKLQNSALKSKK